MTQQQKLGSNHQPFGYWTPSSTTWATVGPTARPPPRDQDQDMQELLWLRHLILIHDTFSFFSSQFQENLVCFLIWMWRHAYAGWMVIWQNFARNNPVIWRSHATPIIEDRESATSLDCPFASMVLPWIVYQCLVCCNCGKFKQETCLLKMENNPLNQNQNTLLTLKGNYLNKTR